MIDLVVVVDLAGLTPEQKQVAGRVFRSIGFSNVARGTRLPSNMVCGVWTEDDSIDAIRNALLLGLRQVGVHPRSLLVASYVEMAWIGQRVT